ncbi:PRC-barrel domain containing protein [Streptomyces xantholiticus]|uniref:PRC-barrel domain containing protein n=1 Tax=Streptomyces xantholiticus TaxID=68285 RepID=UPI001679B43F|nr:PRC-barrel domain containing protein [Streptomyces xantholiticus]
MAGDMWGYPETARYVPGAQLVGYSVEASDGSIGKVDKHTEEVGRSYLVVDTGPWILGRRVLLPAGLVSEIDTGAEIVRVACTKSQVKDSPEFESGKHEDDAGYIQLIESHYANRHM